MHIVILGCGRVGSLLAHRLDDQGHSVAVIDMDAKAFRRLGDSFSGTTVTGIGFDRETLESAGITRAHGFAAVSSGDNTNILSARVARETYGVAHVVARIYDPGRAEVYERLGIPTVATVSWTAGQIMRQILPSGAAPEYVDPSGSMMLAEVHVGDVWLGRRATDLQSALPARIGFLTRYGSAFLPDADTVLQQGDLVHVLMAPEDRALVEIVCEKGEQS